jgi:small subunit ribosomal protein S15
LSLGAFGGREVAKKKRGSSHSTRPVSKRPPNWCGYQPDEVEAIVYNLAKEDLTASNIGIILRDQHGIPLVKSITGKSISQILRESDLAPSLPEDLEVLMKKAVNLRIHLERNNKDLHNKRFLQLTETRIRKLGRYYQRRGVLPPDWKYR